MLTSRKNLNNNNVINIDNNKTLPIPNGAILKGKKPRGNIARSHQPLKRNCRETIKTAIAKAKNEIIMLMRTLFVTQNLSSY